MPEPTLPRSSYIYEVYPCPTIERLQHVLEFNKNRAGFYWYAIPQTQGCILVIAVADPEAIAARTETRIELGLKPLKEHEAKDLIKACTYLAQSVAWAAGKVHIKPLQIEGIDSFITWLYEQGYELCKRVEKEVKP